ncbi:hypothetical protein Tco_0722102, partial [Tanacetum coccineum]
VVDAKNLLIESEIYDVADVIVDPDAEDYFVAAREIDICSICLASSFILAPSKL